MTLPEPLAPIIIEIDGVPHIVERVPLDALADWRDSRQLVPVARLGGLHTWPPAILYERPARGTQSDAS